MGEFQLISDYSPGGDQPQAIEKLAQGIRDGKKFQTLLGATGTGKTYTIAQVIQKVQRPTLVIAHNKTLAAQLCSEFREFFPEQRRRVLRLLLRLLPARSLHPADRHLHRERQPGQRRDQPSAPLRHASLLERRDVIVVSSVSCIYGLGSPDEYKEIVLAFKRGEPYDREEALRRLIDMQFTRNNMELTRGTFRVRGDTLEIQPADEEIVIRVEFFGDDVEKITLADPLTGELIGARDTITVFSASHFVTSKERLERAIVEIEAEMKEQVAYFRRNQQLMEAQRIEQRTRFDIEMMKELGYCSGIENYSRVHGRTRARHGAVHAARLLPERLPAGHRREPPDPAADTGHVQRRQGAQRDPYQLRFPPALRRRQPPAEMARVRGAAEPDHLRLRHARPV